MSGTTITANDIISIIRAAKISGLKKLKLNDLELEFDTNFHPNKTKSNTGHKDVTSSDKGEESNKAPSESLPGEQPKFTEDDLLFSEMMDQMNIENPAEHEELQLKLLNKGN
jgi:hypothetical protein